MSKLPAFQFYPKDFLADENVRVMTLPERGAYITLICMCWLEGSIPSDLVRLARVCGVTVGIFRRLWPALHSCFRVHPDQVDRLIHPRLEREREKQDEFRQRQSDNGRRGGRPPKPTDNPTLSQNKGLGCSGLSKTKPKKSSPISDLRSPDSSQETTPRAHARSKRPIFSGQRFVVFDWMLDDLRKLLGSQNLDAFDLHEWFYTLDARAEQSGLVIPQRDGGKWLQEQTLDEAARRGLVIAAIHPGTGKTAGNAAAIARFVARGQE